MLVEFSFGNFRSYKGKQTLNMQAAKITSKNKKMDRHNVNHLGKDRLLKTKAIYGANASGKSNIVKALSTFQDIVMKCVKDDGILALLEPFELSTTTLAKPSHFQLTFKINGVNYRYGFEANKKEITKEWLYGTPNLREVPFFKRTKNTITELNKKHFEEGGKLLSFYENGNQLYRTNSLFLSTVAVFNGKLAKAILEKIEQILPVSGLGDVDLHIFARGVLKLWGDERFSHYLKLANLGMDNIVAKEPNGENKKASVFSQHAIFDAENKKVGTRDFKFIEKESEGTQKMFALLPLVQIVLRYGRALIIDEFDARLHPSITKKIVQLFNSKQNDTGAQLIFITHDTNLLSTDLLRRDQIDFVEKDNYGASHLYPLLRCKGVRNTASLEKDYVQGKYGAIPFVGDLDKLFYAPPNTKKKEKRAKKTSA